MPFSIRPYRRFPVQCFVTYNAGPFQGQAPCGTSRVLAGVSRETCPCAPAKSSRSQSRSQMSNVSKCLKRWSRGQEFAVENLTIETHTHARLQHYVK